MSTVIEISVQSGILILLVLGLRAVFQRKISARVLYAFWLVPLIRLLMPVSIPSPIGVLSNIIPQSPSYTGSFDYAQSALPVMPQIEVAIQAQPTTGLTQQITAGLTDQAGAFSLPTVHIILLAIWLIGILGVLCYFAIINTRFLRALMKNAQEIKVGQTLSRQKLPKRTKIYLAPDAASPCVWGLWRKRIVLTETCLADERICAYALRHEIMHIRQHDGLIALVRMAVCAVYWFHPLVWAAAKISHFDGETSCDERVTADLGFEKKMEYGQVLLGLVTNHQTSVVSTATTMMGGRNMKKRIRRIAGSYQTSKTAAVIVSVCLVLGLLMACTTADDTPKSPAAPESSVAQPSMDSEEEITVEIKSSAYTKIIRDSSGYLPTMSSIIGLPVVVELEGLDVVILSCDYGAFIANAEESGSAARSITILGEDIGDDPVAYWVPFNTAGTIENLQSDNVRVNAVDASGNRYHQTMRILLARTYTLFDMPNTDSAELRSPSLIAYNSQKEQTLLYPTDFFYTEVAQFAAQRITALEDVERVMVEISEGEAEDLKQANDWVELYYPKKYLAGTFVGTGDNRTELMLYTRILMFTSGDFSGAMLLYDAYQKSYAMQISLMAPEAVPQVVFEKAAQSTSEQDGVRMVFYAFEAGDFIFSRASMANTGSGDVHIDAAAYITLNVSLGGAPIEDHIGERNTKHTVTLKPGETLDVGIAAVDAGESGTYTLSGRFGEYELPALEIKKTSR